MKPVVTPFFHEPTNTVAYVVADDAAKMCAIVDSVLDFDYASGGTSTTSADEIIAFVKKNGYQVQWILETHVHADHISAAPHLRQALGGTVVIGDGITVVQNVFGKVFNAEPGFARDGSQFDRLFHDGETFQVGTITATAMHTPGHTPACMTYLIGDAAFVGDTIFMPDAGTARCDFPGGDAHILFQSVRRILSLPAETRIFVCHDYTAPGRSDYAWETTVGEERAKNIHVRDGISEAEFVEMRTTRDRTLDMPKLILPSVQVNMRAGEMPPAEDNGMVYLKVPVNAF